MARQALHAGPGGQSPGTAQGHLVLGGEEFSLPGATLSHSSVTAGRKRLPSPSRSNFLEPSFFP